MNKAQLGFQATLQMRNRLLQAYSAVMNMPVRGALDRLAPQVRRLAATDQLPSTMSAGASVAGLVTSVASETAVWAVPLPSRSNCSSPEVLV